MVEQGTIIYINFNPTKGHEQAGYRPALIVSNNDFYDIFKLALIVPITSNKKPFPFHIMLDNRTETQGAILCEHIRTVDLEARNYKIVEKIPNELLKDVLNNIKLIF